MVNRVMAEKPAVHLEVYKAKRRNMLTYKMMESYIRIMPDAAANYAEYERVKKMSHAYRSAYKFVVDWFGKKFPHYGELLVKDEATGEIAWSVIECYVKAHAEVDVSTATELPAEEPIAIGEYQEETT